MTSALTDLGPAPPRPLPRAATTWIPLIAALVSVLARLPFLDVAASSDEGGFLVVGGQWSGAGRSLYTGYWVDRPPLLVAIFGAASHLGGLTALRAIGCLAAAALVLAAAWAARLAAGPTASAGAAVVAAALSFSPMVGGLEVNGELLASPFIALGFGCALSAVGSSGRAAWRWAALAGFAAASAALVKQNMLDALVFAVAVAAVSLVQRRLTWRRAAGLAVALAAGTTACVALVGALTVSRGTSLSGVFFAMYPFRIEAGRVVAEYGSTHAGERLATMTQMAALSGILVVAALTLAHLLLHRPVRAASAALVAVMAYDVVSIAGGGSYWLHYLVQPLPAVAVASGVLAADRLDLARPLIAWVVSAALVMVSLHGRPQVTAGQSVGAAIARSARPADSIVVLYGHPDVVLASGLRSPYSQLWSLPVKTLDPSLTGLDRVLAGPERPTWLVVWSSIDSWGLTTTRTTELVRDRYRAAGIVCGRTVYLSRGARRQTLAAPRC